MSLLDFNLIRKRLRKVTIDLSLFSLSSQELVEKYSKLIHRLADVDSEDYSSKMSFYTATLSQGLPKNHSYDHLGSLHPDSNSSHLHAFDVSGNWQSVGSNLGEEDPDELTSSMTSLTLTRRMARSRSLDDMLDIDIRQRRVLKKSTMKRRVGSSKFYTEAVLNALNKGKKFCS